MKGNDKSELDLKTIVDSLEKNTAIEIIMKLIEKNNSAYNQYLNAEEVLEQYPMFSKFTLNKAIKNGLPFFKEGHYRYFNVNELNEWIKERNTSFSEKNKNNSRRLV